MNRVRKNCLLAALTLALTALAALTARALPSVEGAAATDVNTAGFSVVWRSQEPATPSVRVYADPDGLTEVTSLLEVTPYPLAAGDPAVADPYYARGAREELAAAARALGNLKLSVGGCAPGTTYYFRVTSTNGTGETASWPEAGLAQVTTAKENSFLVDDRILHLDVAYKNAPVGNGWLVLASTAENPAPVTACVGDGAGASAAAVNLGALLSQDGFNWNPVGLKTVQLVFWGAAAGPVSQTVEVDFGGSFAVATVQRVSASLDNVNHAPVIAPVGDQGGLVGVLLSFEVKSSDPEGNNVTVTAQNLPAGALFDGRFFTWTPGADQLGPFTVTFDAVDDGTPPLSATQTVAIEVTGPPAVTGSGALPGGLAGVAYAAGMAATGGVTPYVWSVSAGALPLGLSLDPATGAISGTPAEAGSWEFTVRCTGANTLYAEAAFSIAVTGAPAITTLGPLAGGLVRIPYSAAVAATGGVTPYAWSISVGALPPGLALNASSGAISGAPTAAGEYPFTVRCTGANTLYAEAAFSIAVTGAPSVLTAPALVGGVTGSAYLTTLEAADGVTPYKWKLQTGTLPAGLTLNADTGAISGTPTKAGSSTFTIRCTGANFLFTDTRFTLAVTGFPAITTTGPLLGGNVGSLYGFRIEGLGGATPYAWSVQSGALPDGLALNPDTGVIGGTPTSGGTFAFTVRCTGANGLFAEKSFEIVVNSLNHAPTGSAPKATTTMGKAVDIALTVTDLDAGDQAVVTFKTPPSHGTATIKDGRTLRYAPGSGFYGEDSFEVTITDLTGDHNSAKIDVAVAKTANFTRKQLTDAVLYKDAVNPVHFALGDFSGDFVPDLAVIEGSGDNLVTYLGAASKFNLRNKAAAGAKFSKMRFADVDGDSNLDLVALATMNSNSEEGLAVFPNAGGGDLGAASFMAFPGATEFAVADVDGDGDREVVLMAGESLVFCTRQSDGSFVADYSYALGLTPSAVLAADLDKDGFTDLVLYSPADGSVYTLLNNVGLEFAPGPLLADVATGAARIALADLDKDGTAELIVTDIDSPYAGVFASNGDGSFTSVWASAWQNNIVELAVADLNGDSNADLVVSSTDVTQAVYGTATGGMEGTEEVLASEKPLEIVYADVTGDGKVDAVLIGKSNHTLMVNQISSRSVSTATGSGGGGGGGCFLDILAR